MSKKPTLKIYKSSAGSGKTYQLVLSYLSIILKDPQPDKFKKILAITFTNKAAKEMKERIISGLEKLQKNEDAQFMGDYHRATGIPGHELAEKAEILLKRMLHNYGHLNILTIDKFVHRIIRSFSRELGLTNNFELAFDFEEILSRCIDDLLKDLGEDELLTRTLVDYYQKLIDEDENANIEYALSEQAKILSKEETKEHLSYYTDKDLNYFKDVREKLSEENKELRSKMKAICQELIDLLGEDRNELKFGNTKYFASIIDDILNNEKNISYTLSQKEKIIEGKWLSKAKEKEFPDLLQRVLSNETKVQELFLSLDMMGKKEAFLQHVEKNLMGFALLNNIQRKIAAIKKDNNLVLIGELNQIISEIILKEPAPYIYEKIGNRFENYFIDEFQDTSVLQWMNLIPLFHNSLSNGHENLIVGDAKQAIYRWRGGDAHQFVALPRINPPFADAVWINNNFEAAHEPHVLTTNYRSSQSVISFNNWFFENLLSSLEEDNIKTIYQDVHQEMHRKEEGWVEVNILSKEKQSEEDADLQLLLEQIQECLSDGFDYRDLCVLVRANKEGAEIAQLLMEHKLPISSQDSLLLSESKAVTLVFSFLKAIHYPSSENVMKVFSQHRGDKDLLDLFERYKIAADDPRFHSGFDFDRFLKEELDGFEFDHYQLLSLYDKVDYLVSALDFHREDLFLDKFLNLTFEFQNKFGHQLPRFIEHYEGIKHKTSIAVPEGLNAITIMTIHKSKGLQFPVVFLPKPFDDKKTEATWLRHDTLEKVGLPEFSLKLKKDILYDDIEVEAAALTESSINDTLNLLYVAYTRAEDRMYLTFKESGSAKFPNNLDHLIRRHPSFNVDENRLRLGQRSTRTKKEMESQPEQSLMVETSNTLTWREKLVLLKPLDSTYQPEETLSERNWGLAIHELFQRIDDLQNTANLLSEFLLKQPTLQAFASEIKKMVLEFTSNPKVIDIYADTQQILSERSICSSEGKIFRPDKVLEKQNEICVLDFKTGEPLPKHQKQIRTYGELLKKIYPQSIKCYLIYLSSTKIDIVDV